MGKRVFMALLAASSAPALLAWALYWRSDLAASVFVWALAHALILGLPSYLFLRSRIRLGWIVCAGVGAAIAALPLGLLLLPVSSGSATIWINGELMSDNGVSTWAAWREHAKTIGWLAGLGGFSGLAFRAVLGTPSALPLSTKN
jgi:hypothetical protein